MYVVYTPLIKYKWSHIGGCVSAVQRYGDAGSNFFIFKTMYKITRRYFGCKNPPMSVLSARTHTNFAEKLWKPYVVP